MSRKKLTKAEVNGLRDLWRFRYVLSQGYAKQSRTWAQFAGGTIGSDTLRDILILKRDVENCDSDESVNTKRAQLDILKHLDLAIKRWRVSLEKHNAQPLRSYTYDVTTGMRIPVEEDRKRLEAIIEKQRRET